VPWIFRLTSEYSAFKYLNIKQSGTNARQRKQLTLDS
jgi:hypothetical protein